MSYSPSPVFRNVFPEYRNPSRKRRKKKREISNKKGMVSAKNFKKGKKYAMFDF